MYNIAKYKKLLDEPIQQIRQDLVSFFQSTNIYKKIPDQNKIKIRQIQTLEDIENLLYGAGFYIILTDSELENNDCKLELDNCRAVYRGHASRLRKRIQSHLFHKQHLKDYKEPYTVCMQIEKGKSGININEEPYKSSKWFVIQHSMYKSTKQIREIAELAFDDVFGKPWASNEAVKK